MDFGICFGTGDSGAISTQVIAEEFTPPYENANLYSNAFDVGHFLGEAGCYHSIDFSTGRITQFAVAQAYGFGAAGIDVFDQNSQPFTVEFKTSYSVDF